MGFLFTREDPLHVHKTLGVFSMINHIYVMIRFTWQSADVDKTPMLIFMHTLLSISSLQFHVPTNRIKTDRPMIWKEFRLHNIVFACRSFVCILLWNRGMQYQWVVVLCTMLLADFITRQYGSVHDKTMRAMPTPNEWTNKEYAQLQRLYAMAQFSASMACTVSPDLAMIASMPVQLSAFLMTLVRKSKMTPRMWHYVYAFSLWIPYLLLSIALFSRDMQGVDRFVFSSAGARIRRKGVNKYVVWIWILLMAEYCPWRLPMSYIIYGMPLLALYDASSYVSIFKRLDRYQVKHADVETDPKKVS
jgi:hypothetical protein